MVEVICFDLVKHLSVRWKEVQEKDTHGILQIYDVPSSFDIEGIKSVLLHDFKECKHKLYRSGKNPLEFLVESFKKCWDELQEDG